MVLLIFGIADIMLTGLLFSTLLVCLLLCIGIMEQIFYFSGNFELNNEDLKMWRRNGVDAQFFRKTEDYHPAPFEQSIEHNADNNSPESMVIPCK